MAEITRITRRDLPARTSGTVLSEVRRPKADVPARHREVGERLAANAKPKTKPEANKGDVKVSDG